MRAFAHGLSGAFGPGLGAMLGGLTFSYVDTQVAFYVCAGCSIAGIAVTLIFLPDVSSMDLSENDRFWSTVLQRHQGRTSTYQGAYTDFLSPFERWCWFDAVIGERMELSSPILGRAELQTSAGSNVGGGGSAFPASPSDAAAPAFPAGDEGARLNASGDGSKNSTKATSPYGTGPNGGMQKEVSFLDIGK